MTSTRCAVCKYFRRRCPTDCIFSPYFPPDNPQRFLCVHKIYGASNIGKMLESLPVYLRAHAIESLYYEAKCRIQDPVYGCAGIITLLHEEIHKAERQLANAKAEIALLDSFVGVDGPKPSLGESLVRQNDVDYGLHDPSNVWFH